MSNKNEVVEKEIVDVEETALAESELEIREDLNDLVTSAKFEEVKSKYGVRHPYFVTLFNGVKIEFDDTDGLYDLLNSYRMCGQKGYVKSKALVEELKLNDEGVAVRKYICMKYVFEDGSTYRLFPKKFVSNKVIDNYYNFYKANKK